MERSGIAPHDCGIFMRVQELVSAERVSAVSSETNIFSTSP
jgi:hypothetical protein